MKFLRRLFFGAGLIGLLARPGAGRADGVAAPDFKEVYDLIRSHLAGESETELNRDAVQGFLNQLHGKVSIVAGKDAPAEGTPASTLKSVLYDGPIVCLSVSRIGPGLADQISAAWKESSATNRLKGLVLDLRFADGDDYGQAAAAAGLFIAEEKPLLDWGRGLVQSKAKPDAITLPLIVLINGKTSAAAEALAAALREDDRAVILGSNTAGQAAITQEFPLKDGRYLRIATAGVKVGDGETLSAEGVKPDIFVAVNPAYERAYYAHPFKNAAAGTNVIPSIVGDNTEATNSAGRAARPRQINEAELMRLRKEKPGVDVDDVASSDTASDTEPEKPVVRDPVLGRALDLIKGIAAIRHPHSS